jgi:predicted GIY-YIG superfamily endonuclease
MIDLEHLFRMLVAQPPISANEIDTYSLPFLEGVYVIRVFDKPYYVGRTKNLLRRLPEHLDGPTQSARLKKYLVDSGECANFEAAKDFLWEHASFQWLEVEELRPRYFLECYATAILQPKYGVSEEH